MCGVFTVLRGQVSQSRGSIGMFGNLMVIISCYSLHKTTLGLLIVGKKVTGKKVTEKSNRKKVTGKKATGNKVTGKKVTAGK